MEKNPPNGRSPRQPPTWSGQSTDETVGINDVQGTNAPESRALKWLLVVAGLLILVLGLWLGYEYLLVKGDLEARDEGTKKSRESNRGAKTSGGLLIEDENLTDIPPSFEPEDEIIPEVPVPQAEITLPALEDSDAMVKEEFPAVIPGVGLDRWLATPQLIIKFVMLVDNVGQGKIPRKHFKFLAPKGRFRVENRGGRIFLDPRGYDRYRYVAALFEGLDADAAAQLYLKLQALFQAAYEELGYPNASFTKRLLEAIDQIQKVPVIEGQIELARPSVAYRFARPKLERLNALQKQMLRMGPDTVEIIQRKSLAFVKALTAASDRPSQPGAAASAE